jgi:hypothetical protein
MRRGIMFCVLVLAVSWALAAPHPTLAAYSAHQNDQDVNNFLSVYPFAKSTKLDDCALCHKSGTIGSRFYGSCDYCHQVFKTQAPHGDIQATLNPYGLAYRAAGGSQDALRTMEAMNSDGDSYTNIQEIQALTFPGNASDYPGLVPAPAVGLNLERLLALPSYSEFLLINASNSQDSYARFGGVRVIDLLKYAGISKKATQITVFSPDGFYQVFPINAPDPQTDPSSVQYDVTGPYPYGTYYKGLDFVSYPPISMCLVDGDRIPDKLYMLLAYLRDGNPLAPGRINPATLKLDGEGPYRLIPPQKIAGSPDRSCKATGQVGDGLDCDPNKDHNAGFSVRTVAAIRVDPLPDGSTDFNWYEGGWNLVDGAKVVIYGAIDPPTYPVHGLVSDGYGHPVADAKISFSLLSLGQVGEVATSPGKGSLKKKSRSGEFHIDLPAGEYTVVPSKQGCTFIPASLIISLPDPECDRCREPRDGWGRSDCCNGYPHSGMSITANCSQ